MDIKAVKVVVNFDPPNREEDYVHRVGRTGRAGQKGDWRRKKLKSFKLSAFFFFFKKKRRNITFNLDHLPSI